MVVSTTGDGEEPDNMRQSWRFLLRKSLPRDSLHHLKFAMFGLGDSTYPKFNAVARRLQVSIGLRWLGSSLLLRALIHTSHRIITDPSQATRRSGFC